MAIIKCAECGGNVSTSAKQCPHCGASSKKFNGGCRRLFGYTIIAILVMAFLGNFVPKSEKYEEVSKTKSINDYSSIGKENICKAAISLIFGQPVKSISVKKQGRLVELTYTRTADDSYWKYRCKVENNEIIWAGFLEGQWGRWRDGEYDAEITYEVKNDKLMISEKYPGATPTVGTYNVANL